MRKVRLNSKDKIHSAVNFGKADFQPKRYRIDSFLKGSVSTTATLSGFAAVADNKKILELRDSPQPQSRPYRLLQRAQLFRRMEGWQQARLGAVARTQKVGLLRGVPKKQAGGIRRDEAMVRRCAGGVMECGW